MSAIAIEAPKSEAKAKLYLERVILYDCSAHLIKQYLLPYAELASHLKQDCRYVPDIRPMRIGGMVLATALAVLIVASTMWVLTQNPVLTVITVFPPLMLAPFLGWVAGPPVLLALNQNNRPFWLVYYMDGVIVPIVHTRGRGVDPIVYDAIKNEVLEEYRKAAEELELDEVPEYRPTVNTAVDLYMNLGGKLEREENHIGHTMRENLQIGGVLVMALASVGVLFFIGIALEG